jgi:hypothetical protein
MKVSRFVVVLVAAAIFFCASPNRSQARLMAVLSYQEMLDRSDLVVIATPKAKTVDTREQSFLPNIWQQDKDGNKTGVKSIGVETVFVVDAVLKGDRVTRRFTLHHYREAQGGVSTNGPSLVFFDPSDTSQMNSYLLFLVREPDGRFAPTGGQTDPGYKAVSRLPLG